MGDDIFNNLRLTGKLKVEVERVASLIERTLSELFSVSACKLLSVKKFPNLRQTGLKNTAVDLVDLREMSDEGLVIHDKLEN